ncbi:MAG: ppdK, partial [Sporomusa sp.]|nr:ppdK [Sporomusa sp.]
MSKLVYLFKEGGAEMKALLGGKGANLAEMTNIGLPVPPGMTITTEACTEYYRLDRRLPESLMEEVKRNLTVVEEQAGKKFGDLANPLLVSVRSGAMFSMPGMMDTILNLGLNEQTVQSVAKNTNNLRFAYDAYRRFIQMFSDVVLEIPKYDFEDILHTQKEVQGVKYDQELTDESLRKVIDNYKKLVLTRTGQPFPENPLEQLT